MKVILNVVKRDKSGRGNVVLSNKYVILTSPQRSKFLNGKKLEEGEYYLLTLEKIKTKLNKKKAVKKKSTKKKK